jgi:CheY-like chemotaxis protein
MKKTGLVQNAIHFSTAEMALSFIKQATPLPKMVLIDLNLTGMSGLEFLKRLREDERTRSVKTAFLTGHIDEHQFIDTYILGTSSFVLKPLDSSKLSSLLVVGSEN